MKVHTVPGGGGVKLHVRECGSPIGIPILLIHGWSQNHLCWMKQYESELQNEFRIVALDLRGHGMSDAAPQPEQYTDGDKWADDIAAIMDQLALDRLILVSWSYGHAPFLEEPQRFNRELARFAARAHGHNQCRSWTTCVPTPVRSFVDNSTEYRYAH
jgi:pimeloyl-ACP methyl ester carboxylesterase